MNIAVIGGGWAGLAAAAELVRNNHAVTVYEAARQTGGRARAVLFNNTSVDNGQHILIGAYRSVLELLALFGIDEASVFKRQPLYLKLWRSSDHRRSVELRARSLPAPFHLVSGIVFMSGISWRDKVRMVKALLKIRNSGFSVKTDIPLLYYLTSLKQSDDLVKCLWQPLCISILNTPINQASTEIFLRVLKDAFFADKSDSDMLLPIADLGDCFPEPAMEYIDNNGGNVQLGMRVERIIIENNAVTGIEINGVHTQVDVAIVATAPEAASALLAALPHTESLCNNINSLGSLPITTVYLQYPEAVTLPDDFIGILNCNSQWFFDRGRLTRNEGLISVVISGPGDHMAQDTNTLAHTIQQEIALHFPHWPAPEKIKVIREKKATMNTVPGINSLRPENKTSINGLWLAGDYTNTGYPSTLEGAIRSGLACARNIINSAHSQKTS